MAKVIAIANPKGGVGKTTTVINLAASLAIAQKNVLIVDLDPQGATSLGLGYKNKKIIRSLSDVLKNEQDVFQAIYPAIFENLHLLPCKVDNSSEAQQLITAAEDVFKLRSVLMKLAMKSEIKYDYLLLDTPPTINSLSINALIAANSVMIPLQIGMFSLEAMKKLLKTINELKKSHNPELDVEGILLTFYEKNTRSSKRIFQEIPPEYKKYLLRTIIYKNTAIGYSTFKKRPVALVDFHSNGAQNYFSLASELIRNNHDKMGKYSEVFYI